MTRRLWRFALVALVVGFPVPAVGQTPTNWLPAGDGSWAVPGNWGNGIPDITKLATFTYPSASPGATVTLDGASSAYGLSVSSPGGTGSNVSLLIDYGAGGAANLLTIGAGGLTATSANLTINPTVVLAADQTWAGSNGYFLTVGGLQVGAATRTLTLNGTGPIRLGAGGLDVAAGGTFNLAPPSSSVGFTLDLTASQTWRVGNGGVVSTPGLVELNLGSTAGQLLTLVGDNSGTMPQFNFAGRVSSQSTTGGLRVTGTVNGVASSTPGAVLVTFAPGATNNFAFGPLSVTGGTVYLNKTTAMNSTSVNVSGGQLLIGSGVVNAFYTGLAPTLTLSGNGAYNLGLPDAAGTMVSAVPFAHTQTYAAVNYGSTGAFNTGAGTITVSGTFTASGAGAVTVTPGGTLSVNRLDMPAGTAGQGVVFVRSDAITSPFTPLPGALTVGAGGLALGDQRQIALTTTAAGANIGSQLVLNGDVAVTGTASVTATGLFGGPHKVNLGSTARVFDVAAGGTLTMAAPLGQPTGTAYGLVKRGAGLMNLTVVNSYTGPTRVEAGTLRLGQTGAALNDSSAVTLAGGTLSTAGGSGGTGIGETAGALFVSVSSTVELGTGAHELRFATLTGIDQTGTTALTVTGWAAGGRPAGWCSPTTWG